MTATKSKSKQGVNKLRPADVADQLEHAFLAGLGALSDPQKIGSESFESLVKKGRSFQKKATARTEKLIDEVQEAIRDMTGDAQSKATGLLDQVRDASKLDKLNSAFDSRVAGAMSRLGVASKKDVAALNRKMDKVLKAVADAKAPAKAKPKATAKRRTKKKVAKRPTKKAAPKKKVSKKKA
ncbi:MAG: phasin family protein [Gammaproteobacteria bacterium]|nr:phasin family protein [Gammaproteobacteria bacterium]MDH3373830.1 phasin family protein [Gammaproteobacteria bacterium]MDH3410564.1 phasin family protein [Gammaproteobacteria bacterium]MDH3551963.1 phasin family protein [Gammaproteobacteria bacterium]